MLPEEVIVIDIETTGCRPTVDKIIEIGLCHIKDGKIIAQWEQLINPETSIPATIQHLTGITVEMLEQAPTFTEVSPELFSLLNGKLVIAHNVRFDVSFIKNAFLQAGYQLQVKTLCTLKLSRYLFPELNQHSLDAINQRYMLSSTRQQHRALADAKLVVDFINRIQEEIPRDIFSATIKRIIKSPSIPVHLNQFDVKAVPVTSGVYRFYGENDAVLYIGKSTNLRARIQSHFAADQHDNKEMRITQQIKRFDWIPTAGELGALLKEAQLIKQQLPILNKRLRRHKSLFSLQLLAKPNEYSQIKVIACSAIEIEQFADIYGLFRTKREAEGQLKKVVMENMLCPKLADLEKSNHACFHFQIGKCRGACVGKDDLEQYNLRVLIGLNPLKIQAWPYPGRIAIYETCQIQQIDEYHIIENWCYLTTVNKLEALPASAITPCFDLDTYRILHSYLQHNSAKIVHIPIKS